MSRRRKPQPEPERRGAYRALRVLVPAGADPRKRSKALGMLCVGLKRPVHGAHWKFVDVHDGGPDLKDLRVFGRLGLLDDAHGVAFVRFDARELLLVTPEGEVLAPRR